MKLSNCLLVAILFLPLYISAQTVLYSDPAGQVHTNTDGPVFDVTPVVDISNCTSIEFSVDYEFPAGWEGNGNMEFVSECCNTCDGDPTDPTQLGCLQNMMCSASPGCWDFMWIQFVVDGNTESELLIGDENTDNSFNNGTFSYSFCVEDEEEAYIDITNQNWASAETNIFTNVLIICWEAQPTIEELDPICATGMLDLIGDAVDVGAVVSWSWESDGTAVIDDDGAQVTFATGASDGEEFTLTTTDVNGCQGTDVVEAVVSGFEVNLDGGGTICSNNCADESDEFVIEINGGSPLYNVVANINGFPFPFIPAIDVNANFTICSDNDIALPEYDDSTDPPQIIIPSGFFPIDIELISVTDDDGCVGTLLGTSINYDLQDSPEIQEPVPPIFCVGSDETVDLTSMDDEISPDGFDVLWYTDEELEDEIPNPSQYDANDGNTVYAVVFDGDCSSDAIEVEMQLFFQPIIEVITSPIGDCGSNIYVLPPIEDVADIENPNNPAYYLDPNGENGPVTEVNINEVDEIYIYDESGDGCFAEAIIEIAIDEQPDIESPLGELVGCGSLELPEPVGTNIDEVEYNLQDDGSGDFYLPGDIIMESDNVSMLYLIARNDQGCETVVELPIVLESAIDYMANLDSLHCDSIVLPSITPSSATVAYYTGSMGSGMSLMPGDVIYPPFDGELFIYDSALPMDCASEDTLRLVVTDGPMPIFPSDTTACEFIVLPEFGGITGPNIRYAQFPISNPNSTYYPGDTLGFSQRLYILDTIGTCMVYDSMEVTILPEPDAGQDSTLMLCTGFISGTFDLMEILSNPDEGGQFTYPAVPDFFPIDSTNIVVSEFPVGEFRIQYTIEDPLCGLYSSEITLQFREGPYGGENNNLDLCVASAPINFMDLISNPDEGGIWTQVSGPEMISILDSTAVDLSGTTPGNYVFIYVIEGEADIEFCDPESASLFVNIGIGASAGRDTSFIACKGEVIELLDYISPNAANDGAFEGDNIIFNGTSWNTGAADANMIYDISYIVQSDDMNCPDDTAHVFIELVEQLYAGDDPGVVNICEQSTVNLFDYITNASAMGTIYLSNAPMTEIVNGMWTANTTTEFIHVVEGSPACPSDTLNFTITVLEEPEFLMVVQGQSLCANNIANTLDLSLTHQNSTANIYTIDVLLESSLEFSLDSLSNTNLNFKIVAAGSDYYVSNDTLYVPGNIGIYNIVVSATDATGMCPDNLDAQFSFEVFDSFVENIDVDLCPGVAYTYRGQQYNVSQIINIPSGVLGCDTVVNLTITRLVQEEGNFIGNYCEGDTVVILGMEYTQSTNTLEVFENAGSNGCDSLVQIEISFESSINTEVNPMLCEGDEIMINNKIYNSSNPSGRDTLISASGCDSILIINLDFIPNSTSELNEGICGDEEIMVGTDVYNSSLLSGTTVLANAAANGCDSIINVNLELLTSQTFDLVSSICPDGSVTVGNDTYDANQLSGTTILQNASASGCDSIVNVTLTLLNNQNAVINEVICQDESIIVGQDTYDQNNLSGTSIIENGAVNGCDSIIDVSLELAIPLAVVESNNLCPGDNSTMVNLVQSSDLQLPLELIVDGNYVELIQSIPYSFELVEGIHDIELLDASGCSYVETILIEPSNGEDLMIDITTTGDNGFNLGFVSNFSYTDIAWSVNNSSSVYGSLEESTLDITVAEDTEVSLQLTDSEGCTLLQTAFLDYVFIEEISDIYIPNIIDVTSFDNNVFRIFPSEGNQITEMSIYDRWGNLMYNASGDSDNIGWDGRFNERYVEQGVYVYKATLLNSSGREEQLVGSITLIR